MMRTLLFTIFILQSLIVKAQYTPVDQDTDDLSYMFMNFQAGVESNNPQLAAQFMDSNSMAYMEEILYALQNYDSTQLVEQRFGIILPVMMSRFMAADGQISKMKTGQDYFIFFIKNSLAPIYADQKIVDIKVEGNNARVYTRADGSENLNTFYFFKIGEDWKISLTKELEEVEKLLDKSKGMTYYGGDKALLMNKIAEGNGWNGMGRNLWNILP
ncbi:MAG: hypothetical protein M9958_05765 [Chitinophagales bacterium]|nr:hypothetical protein [Chitinophagales bacterium]